MACKNSLTILTRFVKQHLHGGMPDSIDVEGLKKEVEELRQKNSDLESQVAQLQAEVCPFITVIIMWSSFMFRVACKSHRGIRCEY